MKDNHKPRENESAKASFLSMGLSLLLVVGVFAFVVGFKYFLGTLTYHGKQAAETTEQAAKDKEYLKTDKGFSETYLMIKALSDEDCYANKRPGKRTETSKKLADGQILCAVKKGTYDGKTYYRLKNGLYLRANKKHIEELSSYEKLDGYVVITYISTSGVRLRRWADFEADNVEKSVYVGDQINIQAKVITKKGNSAYITEEGLYLTTDIQYLNDYTSEPTTEERRENTQEKTAQEKSENP